MGFIKSIKQIKPLNSIFYCLTHTHKHIILDKFVHARVFVTFNAIISTYL